MAAYYTYPSPPPAYSQFASATPIKFVQGKIPSYPSSNITASIDPVRDARDKAKYKKSREHAKAIFASAPRKDYMPCPHPGCTNVANNLDSLIVELQMHEVANSGVLCPTCTNWFEHWEVMDRHMCPGPSGFVQSEDPYDAPCAPPIQSMAKADPCFFHQSMQRQQYAIVAARRAMELRKRTQPGRAIACNFHTCTSQATSEPAMAEHLFNHFVTACGGLCPQCKHWCASVRERDAHNCSPFGHSHSEVDFGFDSNGSETEYDSDYDIEYSMEENNIDEEEDSSESHEDGDGDDEESESESEYSDSEMYDSDYDDQGDFGY